MSLGLHNAAALRELSQGGKGGAWSYIKLHVPEEHKEAVISTVRTVIKRNERLAGRRA